MENNQSTGQSPNSLIIDTVALIQLSMAYFQQARIKIEEAKVLELSRKYPEIISKKDKDGNRLSSKVIQNKTKKFKEELRKAKVTLDAFESGINRFVDNIEADDDFIAQLKNRVLVVYEFLKSK